MKRIIITTAAVYLLIAMASMDVSPANWSAFTRVVSVITVIALLIIMALAPKKKAGVRRE